MINQPRTREERNSAIDGLRFIAAICIVLLHTAGIALEATDNPILRVTTSVTYVALFVFFAVSGYLHGSTGGRGRAWLGRRAVRLGVPYACWSAVFLGWTWVRGAAIPPILKVIFFAGAHEVLWSLPMLIVCAVIVEMLVRTDRARVVFLLVCCIVAAASAVYSEALWVRLAEVRQFALGTRWVLVYCLGMQVRSMRRPQTFVHNIAGFAVVVAVLGWLGLQSDADYPVRLYRLLPTALFTAAAVLILLAAHSGRGPSALARFQWGGRYLIGIYASHYLWLEIFATFVPVGNTAPLVWATLAWAFASSMALGTSYALSRGRYTKALVG
ncbi:MAG TPA: acyltransferase [Coriobacteriia bacterium]|nr:acyltransferase [Coriobacteriia bacterium]